MLLEARERGRGEKMCFFAGNVVLLVYDNQ